MASSRHHHRDELIHDSEETSDSNEEFASASEGDDDLPWEPVIIRSPVISKQSPQLYTKQEQELTPRPAPATLVPGHGQGIEHHSHAKQEQFLIHAHPQQHQQHQQHHQQHQQQQQFHQVSQFHHTSTYSDEYTNTSSTNSIHTTTATSHSYSQSQLHTRPQINQQHQHQHIASSSSSSTSTRSQFGSSQTLARSVTPKLRERMRQSPVLQSKVVQAYLDPNASLSQRQLMTPEYVRQAWLQDHQDDQQESSGDDGDFEDEQVQTVPVLSQVHSQVHSQQHMPVAPQAPSISFGTLSHQDQHHEEESWGFDESVNIEETNHSDHADQIETSWGFDENIESGETFQSSQAESSLGHQHSVNLKEPLQPSQRKVSWELEENIAADDTYQPGQEEASWGFNDDIVIDELSQPNQVETSQRSEETVHVDDTLQLDQAELSWGFDDNVVIDDTVQPDQEEASQRFEAKTALNDTVRSDQMDTSWGFDDQLEIGEPPIERLEHHSQSLADHQVEEYPHIHHIHEDDEDAWGYDDQVIDLVESASQDMNPALESANVDEAALAGDVEDNKTEAEPGENRVEPVNPFLSPEDDVQTEETPIVHQDYLEVESTTRTTNSPDSPNLHHPMKQGEHYSDTAASYSISTENSVPKQSEASYENHDIDVHDGRERVSETYPSGDGIEIEDVEASWGFDMDEVLDIETQPVADEEYPFEQEISQQNEQESTQCSSDNAEVSKEQLVAVELPVAVDQGTEKSREDMDQFGNESDNEHDSEVREVLRTTHSNTLVSSESTHQTTTSSVTVSSAFSDSDSLPRSTIAGDGHVEESLPSVHTLSLQIKTDTLPEFVEASTLDTPLEQPILSLVGEDVKGPGSDSEGSDIYGDLSTARTALVGSSNRLNEILDDDDFLEHMERGVPMNRSISTPISDDEQPKFIVDDDLVELMERGEPRPIGGTPVDTLETLDEIDDDIPVSELNDGVHAVATPSFDNVEATVTTSDQSLQEDYSSTMDAIATVTLVSVESSLQDRGSEKQEVDQVASSPDFSTDATDTEPEKMHSMDHINVVSDDQDPANPFSDAAAIDDQDERPSDQPTPLSTEEIQERTEELSLLTTETNVDISTEAIVSDPQAEQNLDVTVEQSDQDVSTKNTNLDAEENAAEEQDAENAWDNHDASIAIESPQSSTVGRDETTVIAETSYIDQHEERTETQAQLEATISKADMPDEAATTMDDSLHSAFNPSKEDEILTEHGSGTILNSIHSCVVEEHTHVHSSVITASTEAEEVQHASSHHMSALDHHYDATELASKAETDLSTEVEEAFGEDAWTDQADETVFNTKSIPTVEESKEAVEITESNQEGSYGNSEFSINRISDEAHHHNLDDTIDAALEDDTWADQDVNIVVNIKPEILLGASDNDSHDVNVVHDAPSSETNLSFDRGFDTAIAEDAWDNQGISVALETNETQLGHESKLAGVEDDHNDDIPAETDVTTVDIEKEPELESGFDIDQTIDMTINDDAWGDQDAWSDHEVDIVSSRKATHSVSSITRTTKVEEHHHYTQERVETHGSELTATGIEVEDAINNALEEDMWDDQNIDINIVSTDLGHNDTSHPSNPTSVSEDLYSHHELQVVEMDNQSQVMPTSPPIPQDLPPTTNERVSETEFNIDEALEADAWDIQDDGNAYVEQVSSSAATTVEAVGFEEASVIQSVHKEAESFEVSGSVLSDIHTAEPTLFHSQSHETKVVAEDAWGWDDDDVEIGLETQNEKGHLQHNKSLDSTNIQAQHTHEQGFDFTTFNTDNKEVSSSGSKAAAAIDREATPSATLPSHTTAGTPERFSPLTIQKGHVSSGGNSGEGDEDSSSQSPWQDVSPASVSKRSEISIVSEVESEFSVRSMDEFERISPAPDHTRNRSSGSGSGSVSSESRKGMKTAMSWTDLQHDEWHLDTSDVVISTFTSSDGQSKEATSTLPSSLDQEGSFATAINTSETQGLPDISGADSWDFDDNDNDSDLQSATSSSLASQATATTPRMSLSRNIKTHEINEHRTFGVQSKTSSVSTPLPGRSLSSYQPSVSGSTPPPNHYTQTQTSPLLQSSSSESLTTSTTATTTVVEVEDDSHLPLAIRQQRARLAAKGKPLPPISKYKKTTSATKESSKDQTSTVTSLSPQVSSTGATSPVISFMSPVSPMLNPTTPTFAPTATPTSPDQKYLSPALQRQRERLEKKKAAAASTAAPPLSGGRRFTVTESTSEQTVTKVASPPTSQTTLSSTLKHTSIPSPTLKKKVVVDSKEQLISQSLSSPIIEEFGQTSRRRGLSASHGSNTLSTPVIPTSPLVESSFTRRSKEGSHPKTSFPATSETLESETIARTSQSDTYRYTSRVSTSSSRSGWDDLGADEVGEKEQVTEIPSAGINKRFSSQKESPKPSTMTSFITNSSSSSFYKQTVPGLDDKVSGAFEESKTTFATSTSSSTSASGLISASSSSYLSSKKADDYDPYGPMASKSGNSKSMVRSSMEGSDDRMDNHGEILIGQSAASPSVSLLSPTSATSISNRHDHLHRQHHTTSNSSNTGNSFGGGNSNVATSNSNSGFFGGGNSLIGDISSILNEKKIPPPSGAVSTGNMSNYDNDNKKASISSSATSPSASNLQKSNSWSFGSWVSSAVAVASEAVDKAYETLDPEYSKMKKGGSTMSSDGLEDAGNVSPYKKPGYVVGGSSLALGLASISVPPQQQQQPEQRHSPSIPPLGFGASGNASSDTQVYPQSFAERDQQHQQGMSPRVARKHVRDD
ncbi:hypothetical protein BGX27_007996 [Mortierella sp. AM989]|nr:hypothetical protein BGX27_007996 [Mortierella sp. AM989]